MTAPGGMTPLTPANLSRAASIALIILLLVPAAAILNGSDPPGLRTSPLPPRPQTRVGFTSLPPAITGVAFTNTLRGDLSLTNAVAHNGSGVAIGDVDGDGRPDLYFCALEGPNRLYRNLGNWRFTQLPPDDAACADQLSTGAAFADVDGDGDLDLLVNGIRTGTRLFLNDGKGAWTERQTSGLSNTASPTSLALADIDGDGDLDLYCTHYIDVMHLADPTTRFAIALQDGVWRVTRVNGEPTTRPYWKDRFEALPGGRVRELPESDGFYLNDGHGRFTDLQDRPGVFRDPRNQPIGPFRDWGLAVMFRDLNGDGAPDFFVCNDNASPDRLWLNTGDGTFREPPPFTFRHSSRSSMSLDFADVNRDGLDDLLVLDMLARAPARRHRQLMRDLPDLDDNERPETVPRYNRNMLFLARPDGTFAETALQAGLAATDWSWCPIFLDVDLDGYEDLLVSNGFEFDVMDQDSHDQLRQMRLTHDQRKRFRQFHPPWPTPNLAFHNRRDGTFEPVSDAWGFNHAGVSNGMALGDLDNDGDLDVVINHLNHTAGIYRNDAPGPRIAVRLRGLPPNTAGIGARLRLTGGSVVQTQEIIAGGRYLSSDEAIRVFAADGQPGARYQLEVRWRNGDQTTVEVRPDTLCEVTQPAPGTLPSPTPTPPIVTPWFRDLSTLLNHRHVEDDFDDWLRQPLLPHRLSRLGPGLSWFDLNGDGWEDLIIPAARGGRLTIFLNQEGRGFHPVISPSAATADQGAVLGWTDRHAGRCLLVAVSNLELPPGSEGRVILHRRLDQPSPNRPEPANLSSGTANPGPMALADIDGDGDLDLFVGGRFRPDRYPEPIASTLWLNNDGQLQPSAPLSQPFASVGLVSGATFADLDGDGDPDLVLALQWGPLRIFNNHQGTFVDVTHAHGLDSFTGCWTSVVAGDFNSDGRLDLAAGNWGRNSLYELDQPTALRLFYGDADEDGVLEIVEAWRDGPEWRPIRSRPWLARGFPDLPERLPTHEAHGLASVQDVWGPRFTDTRWVEATHLDSAVFLNRGSRFDRIPLPPEAQHTPVSSVNVGDFDGDGREDLFLSQNFFGGASDLTREDAGRGLWLRGHGDGTFSAVESGINLPGEQRAAALADFDHDGRIDLAVTQNNGATHLYRNERARPGLRVILHGPAGNPDAIGAQIRLLLGGARGPVRAIQAGSGCRAQDAAVQILGSTGPAEALWIRWPDGKEQIVPLNENQREIRVRFDHHAP